MIILVEDLNSIHGKESLKKSIASNRAVGNRLIEEFNEKQILTNSHWGTQSRVSANNQPIPPKIPRYRLLRKIVRAPEGDPIITAAATNERPKNPLPTISSANSGNFFDKKKSAKV